MGVRIGDAFHDLDATTWHVVHLSSEGGAWKGTKKGESAGTSTSSRISGAYFVSPELRGRYIDAEDLISGIVGVPVVFGVYLSRDDGKSVPETQIKLLDSDNRILSERKTDSQKHITFYVSPSAKGQLKVHVVAKINDWWNEYYNHGRKVRRCTWRDCF